MEALNHSLFLLINASAHPNALMLAFAKVMAEYVIWLIPAIVGIGWLRGNEHTRKVLLEATASGMAGLLINQLIGVAWQHPRPFMIGLGNTFISHVADSSFPSDHLTLFWAVAFSFLLHRSPRMAGLALAFLGLPVAWARIYLGVHFPFDMAGAAVVAILSAWLAFREAKWVIPPVYRAAIRLHRRLFRRLILRGWVVQ